MALLARNYINTLIKHVHYATVTKNIILLFNAIVENKSIKLFGISKNRAQYAKLSRLVGLDSTVKNILDDKQISKAMLENGITKMVDENELLILHDGSDIRKEYANKLEYLGKVRDLNGNIINGYNSFNTVVVDLSGKTVVPLSTKIYSNKADNFISQKDLKLISKPLSKKATPEQIAHYNNIQAKVTTSEYINSSIVAKEQIKNSSKKLKKDNPIKKLTHVIDRGADDDGLFKFISSELKDDFVIRLKTSRITEKTDITVPEKIVTAIFPHKYVKQYIKIQIKSKVYQDVSCIAEYGLQLNGYNVVRIQLLKRDGSPIFRVPMLLISNKVVTTTEQALNIYHIYLKRAKIESVFKFLKEVLGWEESQIRDFAAMKTMLTFCYFVAGYFYEIESTLIQNEVIQFIAHLGGGKGKVTRTYVLRGLSKMITKITVDEAIEEFHITPEQIQEIMLLAMRGF